MYQEIWTAQIDWDEKIKNNMQKQGNKIKEQMHCINDLQIPRWIHTKQQQEGIELHGFCDASIAAYAAVIYIRFMNENNEPQITLLAAKTRIAPKNKTQAPMTLPSYAARCFPAIHLNY